MERQVAIAAYKKPLTKHQNKMALVEAITNPKRVFLHLPFFANVEWARTYPTEKSMNVKETGAESKDKTILVPNSYKPSSDDGYFSFMEIPIKPGAKYKAGLGTRSWFLDKKKNPIKTVNIRTNDEPYVFVAPNNAHYISIAYSYGTAGSPENAYINRIV